VKGRRILLARVEELPPGATRKFTASVRGQMTEAFLANVRGEFVAFVNRCVHLPITLDLNDNDFFTCDGKCVGGPGQGKSLERLALVVENGAVYLEPPP